MYVKDILTGCMLLLCQIVVGQEYNHAIDTSQLEAWEINMLKNLDEYREKQGIVLPEEPDFDITKTKVAYAFLVSDSLLRANSLHVINMENLQESKSLGVNSYLSVSSGTFANGKYYAQMYLAGGVNVAWNLSAVDLATGYRTKICRYSKHTPLLTSMAYDPVQQKLLGVSLRDNALFTIDTLTGKVEVWMKLDKRFLTLAVSENGIIYGIDIQCNLCEINRGGFVREIGPTGIEADGIQSMAFDGESGVLYWAMWSEKSQAFYTVNVESGKASHMTDMKFKEEWSGLYIPGRTLVERACAVTDVKFDGGQDGTPEGVLTWNIPSSAKLTKIEVFRDGKRLASLKGNVRSFQDVSIPTGIHVYRVVTWDKTGKKQSAFLQTFVGEDIPDAVSGVELTSDEKGNGILKWNPVTSGRNGGGINVAYLRYNIYRYPDNKKVATVRGTAILDPSLNELARYHYGIQAETGMGAGEMVYSNAMLAGRPFEAPYLCKFLQSELGVWTIVDEQGVEHKQGDADMRWGMVPVGMGNCFAHRNPGVKDGKDELLVSPPLLLKKERCYRLRFEVRAAEGTPSLGVTFGSSVSMSDQQEILKLDTLFNRRFRVHEVQLPPITETGIYHFGFQSFSVYGEKVPPHLVYVTNVCLEEIIDPVIAGKLAKAPAVDNDGDASVFVGYTLPNVS